MSAERSQPVDPVLAARRELHELTILAGALLRLATRVQRRCDALRHTLGDPGPVEEAELDRYAPRDPAAVNAAAPGRDAGGTGTSQGDPAELLAMSLAGEGLSREQIGEYLRQSFGMEQTDALLDRVLREEG